MSTRRLRIKDDGMYKYLIFDFDGTLVDTNEAIKLSLDEASKAYRGFGITDAEFVAIAGKPLEVQMKHLSQSHWFDMTDFYRKHYRRIRDDHMFIFDGIESMLKKLKAMGFIIAIVSNKGRSGIDHGIDYFGLHDCIDLSISAEDVEKHKPDPEGALKAVEILKGTVEESLFIGDSENDLLCGQNAGMKTVLVGWSVIPKELLLKFSPDFIIDEPEEIFNVVRPISE